MPGLYSHTTRTDGTTITEAIYNADHVNHITNLVPDKIDDYSANVTQANLTSDPGEAGGETLATSLADELAQLKFILAEMKGVLWRTTNTVRSGQGDTVPTDNIVAAGGWPDAITSVYGFRLTIPDGFVPSISLTFDIVRRHTSSTGTARFDYIVHRFRPAAAVLVVNTGTLNLTPGNTNSHVHTITIDSSVFLAGDIVNVGLSRIGADGADTYTGVTAYDGHRFNWTGIACR